MKLCACNCGQPTKPHPVTRRAKGWVKGVTYFDYLHGHHLKRDVRPGAPGRTPTEARKAKGRMALQLVNEDGLSYPQAAAEMEVSLEMFYHYVSDPDGSKARARQFTYRERRRRRDPLGFARENLARVRRYQHDRRKRDTPLDHTTAKGADGPKVAWWLGTLGLALTLNQRRTILRWRNGGVAQIDSLDRLLVSHGRDLSEVPDECWLARARP